MLYDTPTMFDYCKNLVIYIASDTSVSCQPACVELIGFEIIHDKSTVHPGPLKSRDENWQGTKSKGLLAALGLV